MLFVALLFNNKVFLRNVCVGKEQERETPDVTF